MSEVRELLQGFATADLRREVKQREQERLLGFKPHTPVRMRVFLATFFLKHAGVGSAVVVAENDEAAYEKLQLQLLRQKIAVDDASTELAQLDITKPSVTVLDDGSE